MLRHQIAEQDDAMAEAQDGLPVDVEEVTLRLRHLCEALLIEGWLPSEVQRPAGQELADLLRRIQFTPPGERRLPHNS
jgi:hypothetical protein